jgi:hypothetical protein
MLFQPGVEKLWKTKLGNSLLDAKIMEVKEGKARSVAGIEEGRVENRDGEKTVAGV